MKVKDLLEAAESTGADELYEELVDMLDEAKQILKAGAGKESTHRIGGNFSAMVSGDVKLVKNYTEHGYANSRVQWDLCLQVGNNRTEGKALEEVKKLFNDMQAEAKDYEPKKLQKYEGIFHAYFDDGSVSCKYDYGSSFTWIAIRKNAK